MGAEPLEPTIAALGAMIRERNAPEQMRADFAAYLRRHDVAPADIEQMVSVGPQRFLVYRRLVHGRLRNAIRGFIPRTVARLDAPRFDSDFATFMEQRAIDSFYISDAPAEFAHWVAPRWREDPNVPSYLADLATHEVLKLIVRHHAKGGEPDTGYPLALDAPLRFDGTVTMRRYDYPVHTMSMSIDDREQPSPKRTDILAYRDADDKVRYLELTEFAAAVLEELTGGAIVEHGLRQACARIGEPLDDAHLLTAAELLSDLADRKVMLGAELAT